MSSSRADLRPVPASGQGSSGPSTVPGLDAIRDRISARCGSLEALSPEALDLAAEIVAELHAALHGRAAVLAGHRSPAYRRKQLRGEEHALTIEDLAFLLVFVPASVRPAVAVMARACGDELQRATAIAPSVGEALARVSEIAGALSAVGHRALEDGEISDAEDRDIEESLRTLEKRAAELRAAKDARRRK